MEQVNNTYELLQNWGCFEGLTLQEKKRIKNELISIHNSAIINFQIDIQRLQNDKILKPIS